MALAMASSPSRDDRSSELVTCTCCGLEQPWSNLTPKGVQRSLWDDLPDLELANCACNGTLSRKVAR